MSVQLVRWRSKTSSKSFTLRNALNLYENEARSKSFCWCQIVGWSRLHRRKQRRFPTLHLSRRIWRQPERSPPMRRSIPDHRGSQSDVEHRRTTREHRLSDWTLIDGDPIDWQSSSTSHLQWNHGESSPLQTRTALRTILANEDSFEHIQSSLENHSQTKEWRIDSLFLWTRFLQSLSQSSDEFTREHLQIFLMLFHQCSLTQRQTVLLDYWIFHFSYNSRRVHRTNHWQQSIHTDPRQDQQHHSTERIRFEDIWSKTTLSFVLHVPRRTIGFQQRNSESVWRSSSVGRVSRSSINVDGQCVSLAFGSTGEFVGKEATLSTPPRFAQLPTKLALGFPQIIQLLLIVRGHRSAERHASYPSGRMFSKRKTTKCSNRIFSKAVLIFSSHWNISRRRRSIRLVVIRARWSSQSVSLRSLSMSVTKITRSPFAKFDSFFCECGAKEDEQQWNID